MASNALFSFNLYILIFVLQRLCPMPTFETSLRRNEICCDRRDCQLCKIFACCVNFSVKWCVFLHHFRWSVKFTKKKICKFFSKTIEILHNQWNFNKTDPSASATGRKPPWSFWWLASVPTPPIYTSHQGWCQYDGGVVIVIHTVLCTLYNCNIHIGTVLIWRRGGDSEHSCVAGNHSISMTQNFLTLHLVKCVP